ncbi:unnamed protein product [Durusdinium trenchii]|uniref:Isopropylmalate dehydrogenase-like domain-containing protein n=1 Tax=Durusdinium trenchii TaxID=1381693 RepID=A0ABP0JXG1_9DINO
MAHRILMMAGDGVGEELLAAARLVLKATRVPLQIECMDYGKTYERLHGHPVGEEHLLTIERVKTVLKGPIEIDAKSQLLEIRGRRFTSANQALRKIFQLYANVRPAKYLEGSPAKFPGTDLVVIRENTEGMYTGEESWETDDAVVATRRITRQGTRRVAEFAFDYAVRHGRKKVTVAHKSNVLRLSDTLFLKVCREVACNYPEIHYTEQLCDSLLTGMVMRPAEWDVILCENLFGDLVSDLAAGLVGGLGLAPSALCGGGAVAIFEPAHGSAPDIAGQGLVNPTSILLSASLMLRHLREASAADALERALAQTLRERRSVTCDLGGG